MNKNRDKKTIAMTCRRNYSDGLRVKSYFAEENITEETLYGEQLQIGGIYSCDLGVISIYISILYLMEGSKSVEIINKNIKSVALNNKVKESSLLINHYEGKME